MNASPAGTELRRFPGVGKTEQKPGRGPLARIPPRSGEAGAVLPSTPSIGCLVKGCNKILCPVASPLPVLCSLPWSQGLPWVDRPVGRERFSPKGGNCQVALGPDCARSEALPQPGDSQQARRFTIPKSRLAFLDAGRRIADAPLGARTSIEFLFSAKPQVVCGQVFPVRFRNGFLLQALRRCPASGRRAGAQDHFPCEVPPVPESLDG